MSGVARSSGVVTSRDIITEASGGSLPVDPGVGDQNNDLPSRRRKTA